MDTHEPLSDQVFHQFLSLLRYSRQHARKMLDEEGIRPPQFAVLRYLIESGPVNVGQIQAYLHKSPSTTSTLVAQLEGLGFVTRDRSPDDNRVVIVDITPLGTEKSKLIPIGGLPLLRLRLATLDNEQLEQIGSVLQVIADLMEVSEVE